MAKVTKVKKTRKPAAVEGAATETTPVEKTARKAKVKVDKTASKAKAEKPARKPKAETKAEKPVNELSAVKAEVRELTKRLKQSTALINKLVKLGEIGATLSA